ncbi:hypothetical protein ACQPW1_21730 [Nocardia sp. CA-128927]|uniref:hypothetical protein n=1 Tax=Nocardia sp. CA-128927 TaxID=3239975 RepID=UPI003D9962BC
MEELEAQMRAAYGPDWRDEFLKNVRVDPDAAPIELPPVDQEIVIVRKIFLRLPASLYKRFEQLGRAQDLGPSQLVSAWVADRINDRPLGWGAD